MRNKHFECPSSKFSMPNVEHTLLEERATAASDLSNTEDAEREYFSVIETGKLRM